MSWLPDTWIQTLGWTLVHSLWIITLIALGLRLLLAIIPNRRAKARYLLSVATLLATIVALGVTGFYVHEPTEKGDYTALIENLVEPSAFNDELAVSDSTPSFILQLSDQLRQWLTPHFSGILVIWFSGVLFFLVRGTGRMIYLHRLTHRNTQPLSAQWQNTVTRLTQTLGIRRKLVVRVSPYVRSPFVAGLLKPVILLPVSAFSQLSPEQLEAILAHELAHIRRWDDTVNWLQTVVEIILFYHPALWWISQVMRDEREKCCDDLAVATCGSALVYTKALAQLESLPNNTSAFALALSRSGSGLLARIERLIQPNASSTKPSVVPIMVTAALAAVLVMSYQFNPPTTNSSAGSSPIYSGLIPGLPSPSTEPTQPQLDSPWQPALPDWLKEENSVLDTIPAEQDTIVASNKENTKRNAYRFYFVPDTDRFEVDSLTQIFKVDSLSSTYAFSSPGMHILSLDSLPKTIILPPNAILPPNIDLDIDENIDLDLDVLKDIEVVIDSVLSENHKFNFHFYDTTPEPDNFPHMEQLKQLLSDSTGNGTFLNAPKPPHALLYNSAPHRFRTIERTLDRTLAQLDSLGTQGGWFSDSARMDNLRAAQEALANLQPSDTWHEKVLEAQRRSLEAQQQRHEMQLQLRDKQHEERLAAWQKRMEAWEARQQEIQQRFEERQQEMQKRYEERVRTLERQEEQLRQQQEKLQEEIRQKSNLN
ncbi:M56 family metallopeptidase [Tunicatimonas pelagia]|uniref:M56 family metallopeptidase n=1 Tax=Tunicatimonas pelagia TaxID=931531 RepID=UPI0026651DB5|nr:M56 family metallopeptidase [Tunicatimonas pelagia]WKN43721.1 M56 family metallopeptidase [Tunicatimonas pelagia]